MFNVFVRPLQISKSQKGNIKINIPDTLPYNYLLNSTEVGKGGEEGSLVLTHESNSYFKRISTQESEFKTSLSYKGRPCL